MEESRRDPGNLEQKVKEHQAVLLKYPKNIRQVGEIGDGQRIYVEDYVMTYAMHLAAKTKDCYSSAVLLGQKAVVDGRRTLFISGAVEIPQQWQQNLSITGEQWTAVYDQIQKYFHDIEILGWFLTRPGMELTVSEQVHSAWRSEFEGTDKILFLYDNISREEAFYTCKDGEFLHHPGYYIYYEKNEEMQNYMIDEKGGKSSDEGYQDMASRKIRKKIEEKNREHKMYLFRQQMVYTVGILAGAVVLVTAATRLYHSTSEDVVADITENTQKVAKDEGWILSERQKEDSDSQEGMENETKNKGSETENNGESEKDTLNTEEQQLEGTEDGQKPEQGETEEETGKTDKEPVKTEENAEAAEQQQETAEETDSVETTASVSETEGKKTTSKNKNKLYKVKKGDTLESISISHYGTSRYIKKIKKLNHLESADKIYIGQELILP